MARKKKVHDFIQMKKWGHCNGQGLIISNMVAALEPFTPKFVKRYANLGKIMVKGFSVYIADGKAEISPEEKAPIGWFQKRRSGLRMCFARITLIQMVPEFWDS